MYDPGESVVLDVAEGDVPLVVGLRLRVSKVLLKCQVPVHDASGPQHICGGGSILAGLDDDPQQRRRHQAQSVRQPPQEWTLKPVVALHRRDQDQQPLVRMRCRLLRPAGATTLVGRRRVDLVVGGNRHRSGDLSEGPVGGRAGRLDDLFRGLEWSSRDDDDYGRALDVCGGEEIDGAGRRKSGEESGDKAEHEVQERLLPKLDLLLRSIQRAHLPRRRLPRPEHPKQFPRLHRQKKKKKKRRRNSIKRARTRARKSSYPTRCSTECLRENEILETIIGIESSKLLEAKGRELGRGDCGGDGGRVDEA